MAGRGLAPAVLHGTRDLRWLRCHRTAGAFALCSGVLVNVAAGRVLGRVSHGEATLTVDGRVLVRPAVPDPDSSEIRPGAFRWMAPRAAR